ncbi:uncharacterized protein METZ01_LOCUS456009, partial [marine metagenome]
QIESGTTSGGSGIFPDFNSITQTGNYVTTCMALHRMSSMGWLTDFLY